MCLEQDLGRERVEERETGVMTEEIEASVEEVDAISWKFSLSLKALTKEKQKANIYHYWYCLNYSSCWKCFTHFLSQF